MKILPSLLAATAILAWPGAAYAQDASEVESLRAEIAELKQQLAVIAEKVEKSSKAADKKAPDAPQIKWKGAPEISGADGWSFKPRGRIQYDVGTVNAPDSIPDSGATNGIGFGSEARRIRVGVDGTVPGGFGYKIEADITNGATELTDVLFTYKTGKWAVNVGQHNSFQSLEELTSNTDGSFNERASWTDAFEFQRRIGLSAEYTAGPVLLQGGVFTDNITDLSEDGNDAIAAAGRAVFAPKLNNAQLHFGGSFDYTDLGDTVTARRYRQRPGSHISDVRFVDTGNISGATAETNYGLEAAAISGRFHAAAESHWLKLSRANLTDPTFFGASVEAGVYLTDDTREYKAGIFKGIKVKNPLNKGGLGALQFNLRYDHLDLNADTVIGGIQNSYQASLIWTPIDQVRFLVNYARLNYTDAAIAAGADRDYSVDALVARAQMFF